jgi:hypothetical protein
MVKRNTHAPGGIKTIHENLKSKYEKYLSGCINCNSDRTCNVPSVNATIDTGTKDTLAYPYTATYSSDITVPGNRILAQKVLQLWKMFETMDIQA